MQKFLQKISSKLTAVKFLLLAVGVMCSQGVWGQSYTYSYTLIDQNYSSDVNLTDGWVTTNNMSLARVEKTANSGDYYYTMSYGGDQNGASTSTLSLPSLDAYSSYKLEFTWGMYTASATGRYCRLDVVGSTTSKLVTTGSVAGQEYKVTLKQGGDDGASLTELLINQYNTGDRGKSNRIQALYKFSIEGKADDGVYLTVTNDKGTTTYVDNTKIADTFEAVKSLHFESGQYYGQNAIDDIKLTAYSNNVVMPLSSCIATMNFKTSNSNEWAQKGDEVVVDGTTRYQYKDQNGNVIGDGILAVTWNYTDANKGYEAWRILRYYGGVSVYNKPEAMFLLNRSAGEIVIIEGSEPASLSNLTLADATLYGNYQGTGKYVYLVNEDGTAYANYEKGGTVKTIAIYSRPTVSVNISAAGYATYSNSTYALDFTNVTDATAYIATSKNGDNVTMQAVTGTVAAGTGLVLKSTSGGAATVSIPVAESGAYYDTNTDPVNYLFAISSDYPLNKSTNGTNYVLSVQNGNVVFAPIGDVAAPVTAGHAALWIPADAQVRALNMTFTDEVVTGISAVEATKMLQNETIYNLSGQRVEKPTKGIYIIGGKKVYVK